MKTCPKCKQPLPDKTRYGSPGHVIRQMYDHNFGRLRWWAWTDDMRLLGVADTRRQARALRRAWAVWGVGR